MKRKCEKIQEKKKKNFSINLVIYIRFINIANFSFITEFNQYYSLSLVSEKVSGKFYVSSNENFFSEFQETLKNKSYLNILDFDELRGIELISYQIPTETTYYSSRFRSIKYNTESFKFTYVPPNFVNLITIDQDDDYIFLSFSNLTGRKFFLNFIDLTQQCIGYVDANTVNTGVSCNANIFSYNLTQSQNSIYVYTYQEGNYKTIYVEILEDCVISFSKSNYSLTTPLYYFNIQINEYLGQNDPQEQDFSDSNENIFQFQTLENNVYQGETLFLQQSFT